MVKTIRKQTQQISQEQEDFNLNKRQIKVILTEDNIIQRYKIISIFIEENQIQSQKFINNLSSLYGLNQGDSMSYWDQYKQGWIFWCQIGDWLIQNLNQNLIVDNQIKLKRRKNKKSHVDNLLQQHKQSLIVKQSLSKKIEVPKDKQLGYIIKKVSLWRMLYLGFSSNEGELIKIPLDSAASSVGTAKKTLDDYLLQIRTARQIGFDFNSNYNQSIGVLRDFVRANK